MEAEERKKPYVIYYDRCVPRSPWKQILPLAVPWADHFFIGSIRDDYSIFSIADEHRKRKFPDRECLIVTFDKADFVDNITGHPAYQNPIRVIVLEPSNSKHMNRRRLRDLVRILLIDYHERVDFCLDRFEQEYL